MMLSSLQLQRELPTLQVVAVALVLVAAEPLLEHKVPKESLVLKVSKALTVFKVPKEPKVQELLELKVFKELLVLKVYKEQTVAVQPFKISMMLSQQPQLIPQMTLPKG
jgi:hypothetical protein